MLVVPYFPRAESADQSAFSKPDSISDASLRIRKNYSYFRVNYLSVVTVVLAFSLITVLVLLDAWLFLYLLCCSDPSRVVFSRTFSDRETLGILIVREMVGGGVRRIMKKGLREMEFHIAAATDSNSPISSSKSRRSHTIVLCKRKSSAFALRKTACYSSQQKGPGQC